MLLEEEKKNHKFRTQNITIRSTWNNFRFKTEAVPKTQVFPQWLRRTILTPRAGGGCSRSDTALVNSSPIFPQCFHSNLLSYNLDQLHKHIDYLITEIPYFTGLMKHDKTL